MNVQTMRMASFQYDGKTIAFFPSNGFSMQIENLKVTVQATLYGENAGEWLILFENNGTGNTKQISQIKGLDFEIPIAIGQEVIYESLQGDSCGAESFLPIKKVFTNPESFHVEPLGGRPSNTTAFPYFDIRTEQHQFICAIGWTGQWCLDITKKKDSVQIAAGLQDADFYLKPNETARSPRILLLHKEGNEDINHLRRAFRQLELQQYSPKRYLGDAFLTPIASQNFDRYFRRDLKIPWESEEGQLQNIEAVAKCHYFNTQWLDAAWFKEGFPNGVGNYSYSPLFPHGLKPVSDKAHEKGLKFMVWFEPERIAQNTEVMNEHPDWVIGEMLFNLGKEEAKQWLLETLSTIIERDGIDIYRQDFNMEPLPFWRSMDEPNRNGFTEMKHVQGLYWLWDSLLERFPTLMIDNCSSGGRRIDLEMGMRSVPLWRSDTGCSPNSPERRSDIWNQNQTLCLSRYLAYHSTSSWVPDTNEFRSGMTMGIATDFDLANPTFDYEKAIASLRELSELQPLWNGDFYALTEPTLEAKEWAAYQVHHNKEGFCLFFRRESENNTRIFQWNAVIPERIYTVIFSDEDRNVVEKEIAGKELLTGIAITIEASNTSILVKYRDTVAF